ncbi:MAG TPA: dihydrodipicolinate synthase family protein [Candidatus Baltobacteraceae bacterium]|nr:dihydrodipicolinate synthase family protein [Candidatus Baltobacteraceae bacterium]
MTAQLAGVCAAVVTPFDADLRPDARVAAAHYESLLRSGCDSLNVLGTTGEAMSVSVDDRLRFMESIAGSGLPRERMMIGTGATALGDAIRLTGAAFRLGFAAALLMPPFFYRGISDDGVMHFFEHLFEGVHPPANGILLYNFPAMTGITFHAGLVDRLMSFFPGIIGGIKDSSNDADLQREIHERHPDLLVFPSSESFLTDARERGYAGCISGTVALWPQLAARVWAGDSGAQNDLTDRRETIARIPLLPGVRYVLARVSGDPDWERSMPPLMPLTNTQTQLIDTLTGEPAARD